MNLTLKQRFVWGAIPIGVGLFLGFVILVPKGDEDLTETIVRAQEMSAKALAKAEGRYFRNHARFTSRTDSLDWNGVLGGSEIIVARADTSGFRARVMNSGTTVTIQTVITIVDGKPEWTLERTAQTPADLAWVRDTLPFLPHRLARATP